MEQDPRWLAVERYLADTLLPKDEALDAALAASVAGGLPPQQVTPAEGRFLHLLARISGAQRILEIGTLGGYSTICLARALPPGGSLVTLEVNEKHAAVARANVERAGLGAIVEIIVGPALDSLSRLTSAAAGPFDLIFIDADKGNNPAYLQWSLRLSRVGTMIVVDNVVRDGQVIDAASTDPSVCGTRRLIEMLAADPRLMATAIQTVGSKGWDGFAVAIVAGDDGQKPI